MIVVDASAVLEVLLRTDRAEAVEEELFGGATLHAPHLLDLEVTRALRRYQWVGDLRSERARQAMALYLELGIERYPHDAFLPRVWQLGEDVNPCDGLYLALAEALEAPLVTTDPKLAGLPGHTAEVRVVESPAVNRNQFDFDFLAM